MSHLLAIHFMLINLKESGVISSLVSQETDECTLCLLVGDETSLI